jgi:integrase
MNYQKPKRSREYLTKEEVEQLLKAAKDGATRNPIRDTCLLTLLYHHALRVSELCNLRLSDITLDGEPIIYVRHQKGEEPSVHPLYKSDVAALRKWLTIRQDLDLDHDYLFCSERRSQMNRATINLIITTVSRRAGLAGLRPHPHSLRLSLAKPNQGLKSSSRLFGTQISTINREIHKTDSWPVQGFCQAVLKSPNENKLKRGVGTG